MSGFVEIRPLMQQQVLLTKTGTVTIRQNMSDLSTNQDIYIRILLSLALLFTNQDVSLMDVSLMTVSEQRESVSEQQTST